MELYNLKEVVGKLERLPSGAMQVIEQAFDLGLQKVVREAKENHPPWQTKDSPKIMNPDGTWRYHDITTNLTGSIGLRMRRSRDVIEGDVGVLNETVKGDAMEYASKIERDHPFIAPAVEAKKQEWLKHIEEALTAFFK